MVVQVKNGAETLLLFIIILMSSLGIISTDIYLPVLPNIAEYYHVNGNMLQDSISVYFLGLALSQLIYGPLSEKYGRKPIVIFGVTIFILSSLVILIATDINVFLIARFTQAIGACSGITIGRIIVGELYSKEETGKIFATIFPFIGLSPAIAPVIGGLIYSVCGWKVIFVFLGFIGIVLLILINFKLPETKIIKVNAKISIRSILKNYIILSQNKLFWGFALCPCCAYMVNFAYLSETPFLFHKYGYTTQTISFLFIGNSLTYVIGSFISRYMLSKYNLSWVLLLGYGCFLFGGVIMVILTYVMNQEWIIFNLLIPCSFLTFGMGFLLPLGSAGVISYFPEIAGYASGLLGFLQLGGAGLSSALIGVISNHNQFYLSLYIASTALIGFICYIILIIKSLYPSN